jgi:PPP family 3-phenylpropionic acid transporter
LESSFYYKGTLGVRTEENVEYCRIVTDDLIKDEINVKADRQIVTLGGLNFFYYATNSILLPYLPLYLEQDGYSLAEIGLFMMIGPFVAIFAQPFWGFMSDKFNAVKSIVFLLWGLALAASVGLFMTNGFTMTFIFITLLYFFLLPSVPLLDSLMIKSSTKRGISYGSVRMWGSIGFTTIALISGPILAKIGGVSQIPTLYWLLWIFPLLLLFFLKDEQADVTKKVQRISLGMISSILKNKSFLWFLLIVFILMIPHRMNDVQLGLYLSDLGSTASMVSWAWALAAMSEIPTFALISRIMHRYHELSMLGIVAALYTVRWLMYAVIDDPWVLIALQAMHMITFAVFWIVSVQYVVRLLPNEFVSTGQSLLAMVFLGLSGITGGTVGGWLNEQWGGSSMYVFGAALTFLATILLFGTQAYARKKLL